MHQDIFNFDKVQVWDKQFALKSEGIGEKPSHEAM